MSDLLIKDVCFFETLSNVTMSIADATHSIALIKFLITEIELASGSQAGYSLDGGALAYGF